MATEINPQTIEFVKAALKKHGFEHALHRAGVDCLAAGIDADDYTYQLVALFTTVILSQSMMSYSDIEKKFVTLRGNSAAMIAVVKSVTMQLAKQLDEQAANEAKIAEIVKKGLNGNEPPIEAGTKH